MRLVVSVEATLAALASTGCFSYVPLAAPTPLKAGTEIRVEFRQLERFQLSGFVVDEALAAEGEFVKWTADSLVLSAFWVHATRAEHPAHGESVAIPIANLSRLERKAVSLPKTIGLAGATVLGSALLYAAMGGGGGGGTGGRPPVQR